MSTEIFYFLIDIEQGHISQPFCWAERPDRILVNGMRIEVIFAISRPGPRTPLVAPLCISAPIAADTEGRAGSSGVRGGDKVTGWKGPGSLKEPPHLHPLAGNRAHASKK